MVARVRLELTTYRVWTDCSSQLSYLAIMVGMTGFEPATPWSQIKYTTKLCYIPNGAPSRSRTRNLLIRSQMLYPVELSAHSVLSPCFLIVFHSPRKYKPFFRKKYCKNNASSEKLNSTSKVWKLNLVIHQTLVEFTLTLLVQYNCLSFVFLGGKHYVNEEFTHVLFR